MHHVASSKNVKDKRVSTCYSTAYMSLTCDQKHSTISEVAADWHELMIPSSVAHTSEQLDLCCSHHLNQAY